jgi:DtxR family Mn-dependent transcriptional regulator
MPPRSVDPANPDPRLRARQEDALKHLHEAEYARVPASVASLAGGLRLSLDDATELAADLSRAGLAETTASAVELTPNGREQARQIIRAHRLYETYLAHETGIATDEWHRRADQAEHQLTSEAVDALADRLGRPRYDPHGDPIPTRGGTLPPRKGFPLLEAPEGADLLVLHLEDEPEGVYRRAAAAGIFAGSRLRLLSRDKDSLRVAVEDRECKLSLAVAGSIQVESSAPTPPVRKLTSLRNGEAARVVNLSPAIVGGERRRMLDLGLVPGTRIERDFASMLGSPVAYRVRGATIALRKEQSDRIFVEA